MRCRCLGVLLLAGALAVLAPLPCGAQGDEGPRPDLLRVVRGFKTEVYANVSYARSLISIKKGEATITYSGSRLSWGNTLSDVWAVVDSDSDGKPEYTWQLVKNLNTPSGIALDKKKNILYVSGFAGPKEGPLKGMVWALKDVSKYALEKKEYQISDLSVVTDKLPGDTWHGWRYMKMAADGNIIIPVGINCNVCEQNTTADGVKFGTIYKLNPLTGKLTQIADGVRNSVGMDFHPDSGKLYFTDNGRDSISDDVPDCELNVLSKEGQSFGFPYCIEAGSGDPWKRPVGPGTAMNDPNMNPNGTVINCKSRYRNIRPIQVLGPHVAPLGVKFYRWSKGANFPKSYDRMAFIVERGSWDRTLKIGYRVVMMRINDKVNPPKAISLREFMWGWLQNKDDAVNQYSWGRPADVEQLPDGSLLVSDDTAGMIYRVSRRTQG